MASNNSSMAAWVKKYNPEGLSDAKSTSGTIPTGTTIKPTSGGTASNSMAKWVEKYNPKVATPTVTPEATSTPEPEIKSGKTFLQKLADVLSFSTNMTTASDMQIYGNDALKVGGQRLQTQTEQNAVDSAKEFGYIAEKGVAGAAKGVESIVNALGYMGQALSRTQNLQASQDAAIWGAVTGSDVQKSLSERLENTAMQSIQTGLQDTTDFGTRYQQKVEDKYSDVDITQTGKLLSSVSEAVGGMTPAIASNLVAPGSGIYITMLSAGGSAAQEAKASGANDAQALAYGAAVGAIEAATEKIFDGVAGVFGKGAADDVIESVAKKLAKSDGAQSAIVKIADGLGEGFEEFISEFGQRVANEVIIDTDDRSFVQTLGDAGYSFLMGAAVSGVIQAAGSVVEGVRSDPVTLARQAADAAVAQIKAQAAAAQNGTDTVRQTGESLSQGIPGQNVVSGATEGILTGEQQADRRAQLDAATSDTQRSGIMMGVDSETIAQAERISNVIGKQVMFYRAPITGNGMENGYYDSGSATIWVNANGTNTVAQILSHEMTHSVEFTQGYQELSSLVLTRIQQTGGDLQQTRQAKKDLYAQNNVELKTDADADAEIVAEYVAEHLLTDEQSITEMAQYNPSLGRRILDWLNNLLAKMGFSGAQERAFVTQATSLYNKALNQSKAGFGMDPAALAQQMQSAYAEHDMTEQEYDDALDLVMQEESLAGRSMLDFWEIENGGRQYLITEIEGEHGNYGQGVLLDTDLFNGVHPRNWGDILSKYVYKNLAGKEMTIYDENGNAETVHIAKESDRVRKVGAKNSHKVLDEMARYRGNNTTALATVHLSELLETSGNETTTDDMSHQWLDENGWRLRTAYAMDLQGRIYEMTLNIADGRKGLTMYKISRVHQVDTKNKELPAAQLPSAKNGGARSTSRSSSEVQALLRDVGKSYSEPVAYAEDLSKRILAGNNTDVNKQFSISESPAGQTVEELPTVEVQPLPDVDLVSTMPTKAQESLKRAERSLANQIGAKLSVPKYAQRSFLNGVVRDISTEYLRTGTVSQETIDSTFEQAYREGVVADSEFYDQYKHIKNYLRTTKLNISDTIKGDIADFGSFRKSAFGTLNMVQQSGIGVDTAYDELTKMAPELFPASITNPSDQLIQMFEVGRSIRIAEKSLDEYHGQDAEEFKRFAKHDYEVAVNDTLAQLRLVKRYTEERARQTQDAQAVTLEEVQEAYPKLKDARRKCERVVAQNLLTEEDNRKVGQLLRGDIDESNLDPAKDNVSGIMAVYQAKQEYEQYARRIRMWNQARKAKLQEEADSYLATANSWKDKKMGIQYSRETMERNIRDIVPDADIAYSVIDRYFTPVHDSQAAATRTKNDYRDRVKALDLSRKVAKGNEVSEAHAVQLLGEAEDNIRMLEQSRGRMKMRDGKGLSDWKGIVDNLWTQNPNLNESKIRGAVEEFRKIYDELFTQMNTVRVRNGYEPINYRNGYFPHFQPGDGDGIMVQFGKALGIDTAVTALPTTINGLTHTFKPGIQWFGNAQERLGFNTAYDAVEGFDKYIEGCADVIYQTDNIQALRALASQMRYRTSDEGIRKQVDAVRADTTLSEEDKNNRIEKIYESGKFTLSNFVVELEEYTNLLANKKSRADRNTEQALGRNSYNLVKALESRVAANMVAVNPASWLTNFIPLTQGNATLDRGMLLKGMWDTLKAYKTDDGIVGKSTFLTNRRGSDPIVKTWSQNASAAASKPMEWIDSFTADTLVRARYNQNLKRGLSEAEAMSDADSWVAGVMADRSKGSTPTLFNRSNPVTKIFTQFQLEVNNQLSYLFKDIPNEAKEKGGAAIAGMLIKFMLGAYLYDEIYEYFIGRRPALDPLGILNDTVGDLTGYELPNLVEAGIDLLQGETPSFETEKVGTYEALSNAGTALVEELPFIGGVLGGGRVPISSALPDFANLARAATDDSWSAEKRGATAVKELSNPATYLALPFGGGQIKKVAQGIQSVVEGGSYTVDAEGNDLLQYPVYSDTPWETIKSVAGSTLFGKSTLPTGREWVESGFKTLTADETKAYQNMRDAGIGERDAYELIKALKSADGTSAKWDAMEVSEVSDEGKDIVYYNVLASDKERALMDELSGLSEDARPLYDTLMYFKECGSQADKLAAISSGNYSDEDIRELTGFVMGTELKTEKGNDTEYAKLLKAMDTDLSAEDAVQMKADGLDLDKFLEFEGAGVDANAARELLEKLDQLTPKSGSETVSKLQKYRVVVDSGMSEQDQMDALGVMMGESEFSKLQVGYDYGVVPDVYVDFKETMPEYDADGNGNYKQAEIKAAIDAMGIDDVGMKAALWQLANKSWKPEKNPYDVNVGRKVYEAMH